MEQFGRVPPGSAPRRYDTISDSPFMAQVDTDRIPRNPQRPPVGLPPVRPSVTDIITRDPYLSSSLPSSSPFTAPPPPYLMPPPGHLNQPPPAFISHPPPNFSAPLPTTLAPQAPPLTIPILCKTPCCKQFAENNLQRTLSKHLINSQLCFPSDRTPLPYIIESMAERGNKFAIVAYKDYADVYSMDLYVLRGKREQLNCVSIQVAVEKIKLHIELEKQMQKTVPQDVSHMIELLKAGKLLTLLEVDKMLKHLVSLRNIALKEQYGEDIPKCASLPPVGQNDPEQKQILEKMENSIMEVLKSVEEEPRSQENGTMQPTNTAGAAAFGNGSQIDLKNESLMRAINDVLKSFS